MGWTDRPVAKAQAALPEDTCSLTTTRMVALNCETPAPCIHPWGASGAPMEQKAPIQAPSPWELPWA